MKEFFGLPPWWKTGPDKEYVEYVRRLMKMTRAATVFSLCMGILTLAMGLGIPLVIVYMMDRAQVASWEEARPGLWVGCFVGTMGAVLVWLSLLQLGFFMNGLNGNRTERLLLKYFDKSEEQESANE